MVGRTECLPHTVQRGGTPALGGGRILLEWPQPSCVPVAFLRVWDVPVLEMGSDSTVGPEGVS